jgi:glutaredoxin
VTIEITLIGRSGCHLCELAQNDLAQVIARFAAEHPAVEYTIDDVEIDQHPEYEKYADEIPVLLINGSQHSFWRIDPERTYAALERQI